MRFLSNIFKGSEIEAIGISPYQLHEVATVACAERSAPAAFEGFNHEDDQPDPSEPTYCEDPAEAERVERERIDQIEKEAYAKAFELGERTGIERGEQMYRSAVQTFVKAVEEVRQVEEAFYKRVEQEILDLVLAATRKVVQREVDSQKGMILDVLKEAIAKVIDRERIRVRINPSDYDFVHAHKPDILQTMDGIKYLAIEKDEAISRGGAVVESDCGTIDARIERRFEEVEKALKRQRAERGASMSRTEPAQREKEHAN